MSLVGDLDRFGRSERVRSLARRLYGPVYRHWFRAEWEGLEHVPRHGGAVLVANHGGALPTDAPAIMHGIETEVGRPVYGLADGWFLGIPGLGTLSALVGLSSASPGNGQRVLHDGQQLALMFPEGAAGPAKLARERYQLRAFDAGFVTLAMRAGVPVVPIAVVGSDEASPLVWKSDRLARVLGMPYAGITANQVVLGPVLGSVVTFPVKFRLRALPPIHFDAVPHENGYDHTIVAAHADRVRAAIQDAVLDMLRTRRSIWS